MRRRIFAGFFAATVAVGTAQLAGAGVVERIRIADPARRAHGLPAGLVIELNSPPQYARAESTPTSGTWSGPAWTDRETGETGTSTMTWRVTFDERPAKELEEVVVRNVEHTDWARDQRGGLTIDRVLGRTRFAAMIGYYYLMTGRGTDARVEAVYTFPLEESLYAVVRLELTSPSREQQVVNLSTGSTWNRGQALLAMTGIRLHGNLPPKIVGARVYEKGRTVRGKVVDRFLDPVVGAPVALERGLGGGWRPVARAKTDRGGFYRLRTGGRGAYRVTVNMGGFRAESRPLLAGRGRG